MRIGERIRHIRKLRGMTMKQLGMAVGYDEKTADVRIAQYESGTRTPKAELIESISEALGVSSEALAIPKIEDSIGLMHTLFALEDFYELKIENVDGNVQLSFKENAEMYEKLTEWQKKADELCKGELNKEEYDRWRYSYKQQFEAEKTNVSR